MEFSDFLDNGSAWFTQPDPLQSEALFTGVPTLNTWGGTLTSFALAPSSGAAVEIGDLFDETGVQLSTSADLELSYHTEYIFRARALGDAQNDASVWSNVFIVTTGDPENCTYTQGYWKTHPEEWPVDQLVIGSVLYTKDELLSILNQPANGNGLLILAHQLISTELNIAQGADATDVADEIAQAHALIGALVIPPVGAGYLDPVDTSDLTQILDDYNNGVTGPGHCPPVSVESVSWGTVKGSFR